jgi:hypothetical protein
LSRQPWRLRIVHEGEDGIVLTHRDGEIRIDGKRPGDGALPVRTGLHGGVRLPAGMDALAYPLPGGRAEAHAIGLNIGEGRLVYLGHALHAATDAAWLAEAVSRFQGADWLLVGIPDEGGAAVIEHIAAFGAKNLLVMDLRPPARSSKITTHIALWVDQLKTAGLPVMGVASQVSVRFE